MVSAIDLAFTAGEIKSLLANVPDHVKVQFQPVSNGWMGGFHPLRLEKEGVYYDSTGNTAEPDQLDAHLCLYLYESP